MEITRDRLERESDLELISTAPNVVYRVVLEDNTEHIVTNPSDWPAGAKIAEVFEPIVKAMIIAPSEFIGAIMELCQGRRGTLGGMDYLSETRVELRYTLPLAEIIFDFFDQLKSKTRGYGSLDYEMAGEQRADLVKVDILLQGETVDAFSAIVHKDKAHAYGDDDGPRATHSASAVRGADPGGDRHADHRQGASAPCGTSWAGR
jgi:GTP-binding protein LepA